MYQGATALSLLRAAMLLACFAGFFPRPAAATLTCTLSGVSTVDFGSAVSPLSASATDTSSTFTVNCTALKADIPGGQSPRTVNLCISYDNGTGGASGGGNRQLTSGANIAVYDVYPSPVYGPTPWGSRTGTPAGTVVQNTSIVLTRPAVSTSGTANITVYPRLFGSQVTVPPGTFTSSLTLTVEGFWNDVKNNCASGGTVTTTAASAQTATVTYVSACSVGTPSTLAFGSSGFLRANKDATSSTSVTCTSTTPYKVGLSAGLGVGATTTVRKMTRTAAPLSTVNYRLYQDGARSVSWGNDTTGGTDTQNGTGTGSAVPYIIYGRVPSQNTPEPGSYQDTVVLTVAF